MGRCVVSNFHPFNMNLISDLFTETNVSHQHLSHSHILQFFTAKMALENEEIASLCDYIIIKESGSKKCKSMEKIKS